MLWPDTSRRAPDGSLSIGGVTLPALARQFGTPLYIYDEATLRGQARAVRAAFETEYSLTRVVFATKALMSLAILRLFADEGLSVDVVSGGELHAAIVAGIDPATITFHGNNKTPDEIREAIAAGVGLIAIDNLPEIELVSDIAAGQGRTVRCLLRVNPGIDTHTHTKIRTGHLDSKFGVPIATGAAARALEAMVDAPGITPVGYHAHIGSQLFESEAYALALRTLAEFAATMRDRFGVVPEVLSPGGGFGIAYGPDQDAAPLDLWARETVAALHDVLREHDLPKPELVLEPGRMLVGRAGVALYTVGSIKTIPGVRTYVAVDGGMSDNIRPSLYGAVYDVTLANRIAPDADDPVTIAGKFCESGDILIDRALLPELRAGDLLALPAAGAYTMAMASNYNMAPRPAMVLVADGSVRLIRRRERYADLLVNEISLGAAETIDLSAVRV